MTGETRRFELSHPRSGWEGSILGVRFVGGRGETDDPIVAHALLEHGVRVVDRREEREDQNDPSLQ